MGDDWGAEVASDLEQPINVVEIPEVKLFGKWPTDEVQVGDISLQDYIACKVSPYLISHQLSVPFSSVWSLNGFWHQHIFLYTTMLGEGW